MDTATVAEGNATDATAPAIRQTRNLENSLRLFEIARAELKAAEIRLNEQQAELVKILESDHNGSYTLGSLRAVDRRIFTVVRAHEDEVIRDEAQVVKILRRYNLFKQCTKLVVDWSKVRPLVDSGVFPQLAKAVVVNRHEKRPYIKIS